MSLKKQKKNKGGDKAKEEEIEIPKVDDIEAEIAEVKIAGPEAKIVEYCESCTFPVEYCDYSHKMLKKRVLDEMKLAEEAKLKALEAPKEVEAPKEGEALKEGEKPKEGELPKEGEVPKEGEAPKKKKKKEDTTKILVTNHKRSKKQVTTTVHNVEMFKLDKKEISKLFSKKFACSSSKTKNFIKV